MAMNSDQQEEQLIQSDDVNEEKKERNSMFLPHKGFIATPILLGINVLVFILMTLSGVNLFEPKTLELLQWGADFGPLTLTGSWWRTLTCNFVHIGIIHILMNMYALVYIGVLLEPILGTRRMFAAYLLTGLCSAVSSLFWHAETIRAGASGAIFGLYGIFLAFLCFHHIEKTQRNALLSSILIFVGYNLIYGLKEGIDNAAHIGGLINGFILGFVYIMALNEKRSKLQKYYTMGGEAGILLIYLIGLLVLNKNVPSDYQDLRHEWDSGLVQAYLTGESNESEKYENQKEHPISKRITSKDQLPPYAPLTASDTWLNFSSEKAGIQLRYPSNWQTAETTRQDNETILLQQRWTNAANHLIITVSQYDTDEIYEYNKKLSLSIPRNAQNEPSEDYKRSTLTINGLNFIKTDNMQHFGAPDEEGYEILQTVLYYFSPEKKTIYAFVMLINDEAAQQDLDDMLENVQFTHP